VILFLEIKHCDIYDSIHPPCESFRYFMVLIDTLTRWSCVCLLLYQIRYIGGY